jgi:hypothetical protein
MRSNGTARRLVTGIETGWQTQNETDFSCDASVATLDSQAGPTWPGIQRRESMRHSNFASRRATVGRGVGRSATRGRRWARASGAVVVGVVALTMATAPPAQSSSFASFISTQAPSVTQRNADLVACQPNVVSGSGNTVSGCGNAVSGVNNVIRGNSNIVSGSNNTVIGSCWVVSGVGGSYTGNNCGSAADTASRP